MLNAIRDMTQRLAIGNQCLASAGLAASGANALTANAVTLTIDGLFVAFAAKASIMLGTLPAFNHEGKSASKATTVPVGFTVKYVLAANAAGYVFTEIAWGGGNRAQKLAPVWKVSPSAL